MSKIKFDEATKLCNAIKSAQSALITALEQANEKGIVLEQHICNGKLDEYKYIITSPKVYIENLELD